MSPKLALLSFAFVAILVTGCSGSNNLSPSAAPQDATNAQLKAIENNPNMPQEQKDALKARLEQQKKAGEAASATTAGK